MGETSLQPGMRARGSASGRPVMVLLDQLGRRWSLRILWELRRETLTFRELQTVCDGVSPSVLNTRLRELRRLQLVEHVRGAGYSLTAQGRGLLKLFAPINRWAENWATELAEKSS